MSARKQQTREEKAQLLTVLSVIALLCALIGALILWMFSRPQTALWVFSTGVGLTAVIALAALRVTAQAQEHLEERLAARDARYRQTLELLPEGVVILKGGFEIEWVNSTAKDHLDLVNDYAGMNLLPLLPEGELGTWLTRGRFDAPFRVTGADGVTVLEVSVVAPDARHMLIVTHDITERTKLDDMRRDFVANVSHELRTPLTVIAGFLDTDDQPMPDDVRAYHRQLMREQTDRMRGLTDDLLMLSRLENKDEHVNEEAELLAMPRLIEDVVRAGMALSNGRHRFRTSVADLALIGYPDEIRSAVMNLVSNAVRYTPDGGTITVSWQREGTGAALTVTDTGIGIAPEYIPRLTERFFRVDKGRSRDTGGTGLGLAIVKHVLRRNGGTLRIESVPGKGSSFTCRFPEERLFAAPVL